MEKYRIEKTQITVYYEEWADWDISIQGKAYSRMV